MSTLDDKMAEAQRSVERLRESHAALLAAAKDALRCLESGPYGARNANIINLRQAIALAESATPVSDWTEHARHETPSPTCHLCKERP